jgi:hypothetical protein
MIKKMSYSPCNPFLQNFKTLKFLYDLVFHQVHPSPKHKIRSQKGRRMLNIINQNQTFIF